MELDNSTTEIKEVDFLLRHSCSLVEGLLVKRCRNTTGLTDSISKKPYHNKQLLDMAFVFNNKIYL
ncbi:MAG: hypothetical protein ACI8WA_001309 [Polaribacter sp.]|jgi:hypothetical protein